MRRIARDVTRSVVCVSVCVSVCASVYVCVSHTDVLCNNSWTDRDVVWGWLMWAQGTRY